MERGSVFDKKEIEKYLITGVWMDHAGLPSHYCVHKFLDPGVSSGERMSKDQVISLIDTKSVFSWEWDYKKGRFSSGQKVGYYDAPSGKILCTEPREDRTKNLKHLIRINWFEAL